MHSHYGKLALNLLISIIIMYLVMFAMINSISDFYNNINMLYMVIMMVAPMAVLMVLMMGSMYTNRRLNIAIYAGFTALFVLAFLGIRYQAPVGNAQFVRSMIPHHSGAILMCREASITDAELRALCGEIISSQSREIDQMEGILARLQQE